MFGSRVGVCLDGVLEAEILDNNSERVGVAGEKVFEAGFS